MYVPEIGGYLPQNKSCQSGIWTGLSLPRKSRRSNNTNHLKRKREGEKGGEGEREKLKNDGASTIYDAKYCFSLIGIVHMELQNWYSDMGKWKDTLLNMLSTCFFSALIFGLYKKILMLFRYWERLYPVMWLLFINIWYTLT